mgnify:CR=1 FL=1
MLFRWMSTLSVAPLALLFVFAIGCSSSDKPELVEVTGNITKNGKPLVDAMVEFYPEAKAGVSAGVTDAEGNFKLNYVTGEPGAAIGKHTVNVTGGRVAGAPEPATPKVDLAKIDAMSIGVESGEIVAPVADPTRASPSAGGPPAPVILSAEVLAGSTAPIMLTMP